MTTTLLSPIHSLKGVIIMKTTKSKLLKQKKEKQLLNDKYHRRIF